MPRFRGFMLGKTIVRAALASAKEQKLNSLPRLYPHPYVRQTIGYDTSAVVVDAAVVFLFISRVSDAVVKFVSQASLGVALLALTIFSAIFLRAEPIINPNVQASVKTLPRIEQTIKVAISNHFQKPISGYVSQHFNWGHKAIDIPGPIGEKINPVSEGTVIETSYEPGGYGFNILIQHPDGFVSRYAHLSKILIKVGDKVTAKTIIGLVGNSGRATGSHLHLELIRNGINLNPEKYLPNFNL